MKSLKFHPIALMILISSCNSKQEEVILPEVKKDTEQNHKSVFPEVQNISELQKTDFVPALESSFSNKKNNIYAATMPFAWNEIKREIGSALSEFTSKDLEQLHTTQRHLNVLNDSEYKTSVRVEGNQITAKAYFRKSLPFEEQLTKFEYPLTFGRSKVESFGFWGHYTFQARINYFNTEDDFSISLFPENREHEIILMMRPNIDNGFSSFTDYLKRFSQEKEQGVYFNEDDKVEIPILEFNLAKSFGQMIGSTFRSEATEYTVIDAFQKNAFVLNENGAEVESEAMYAVDEAAIEDLPKPKMMIFNKPFVVFLKRKDADNPYFGVYIANDELLKKKKDSE